MNSGNGQSTAYFLTFKQFMIMDRGPGTKKNRQPTTGNLQLKSLCRLFLLSSCLGLASGCMNTRLIGYYSSSQVQPREATRWTLGWGLLQSPDIQAECESKSICKVTNQTNLAYILVSALTIGLVVPQKVIWDCCPSNEPEEILK
jgi:hypothetical protein